MWRAFFLACGIFLIVLGVQSLLVDHIVVARGPSPMPAANAPGAFRTAGYSNGGIQTFSNPQYQYDNNRYFANPVGFQAPIGSAGPLAGAKRIVRPQEWMPWSFVAAGAIIVLYTCSLSRRGNSGE